ncbi:MAG: NADH-quinone oxidoreductase subunit A [Actinomycetota bacterium]
MAPLAAALAVPVAAAGAALALRWAGDPRLVGGLTAPGRVPFAGGYPPEVHAWSRFHARYYAMALVFIAFDMEMVFMYPWAVVFVREGAVALAEMGMFILILLLGVLYAWREGALRWA